VIDLYTWTTPNGRKGSIMLEEVGLDYEVHPINIGEGEQFSPDFLAISPNNKIPAIVDRELDVSIFESGAILVYLAEKTGQLLPTEVVPRAKVLEWLMFQMSGIGPMFGQVGHFMQSAPEQIPYAIDRFASESARLMKVLDDQLGREAYAAGDYSIADIALYPWVSVGFAPLQEMQADVLGEGANIERWLGSVGERAAVQRGMAVP
jgi:GST-like protein